MYFVLRKGCENNRLLASQSQTISAYWGLQDRQESARQMSGLMAFCFPWPMILDISLGARTAASFSGWWNVVELPRSLGIKGRGAERLNPASGWASGPVHPANGGASKAKGAANRWPTLSMSCKASVTEGST